MAQKSKAASLTPDLLTSKSVPTPPAPRKQSTDLALAPLPKVSPPEPAKAAAAPAAPAAKEAKSKVKAKGSGTAGALDFARKPGSEESPGATAQTGQTDATPETQPSSAAAVTKTVPAEPIGGDGKAAVADERPKAEADLDYRIRIPVPLDPSEHLELTLAAARSGRSCQEIIVEALFRYLEDIAGPPDKPAAPGPEGQR